MEDRRTDARPEPRHHAGAGGAGSHHEDAITPRLDAMRKDIELAIEDLDVAAEELRQITARHDA